MGGKWSSEAKISFAAWRKRHPPSKETREKLSISMTGKRKSPAAIAAFSAARMGHVVSEETRFKIRKSLLGQKHPAEVKERIGAALRGRPAHNKGKKMSAAACENIRKSIIGRKHSPETKQKMSDSQKPIATAHMENPPADCQCAPHRVWLRTRRTQLEQILEELLSDFPEVQIQKSFGRYCVDAYLPPPYHLAFEADGAYWHSSSKQQNYDARRDSDLFRRFDLPVVRLTEVDLNGV